MKASPGPHFAVKVRPLSLPCHGNGEASVGLMLAPFDGADHEVLAIGEVAERAPAAKRASNR